MKKNFYVLWVMLAVVVFFRCNPSNGNGETPPPQPQQNPIPALAVDGAGNVGVVWIDASAGNREIFFTTNTR